jgi:16S rRNA (guanine966-N2)-methyltransferase
VRISGGKARGITLTVPRGDNVRPATDGMRQALFSSLGAYVEGARFLDLFAGSGAYGLEALSRGAAGGVFVERDHQAVKCLKQNLAALTKCLGPGAGGATISQADVLDWTMPAGAPVPDLVFIDPPYEIITEVAPKLFEKLGEMLMSKPDAVVLFEMPGEIVLEPEGWSQFKRLGKGVRQPTVAFFRRK